MMGCAKKSWFKACIIKKVVAKSSSTITKSRRSQTKVWKLAALFIDIDNSDINRYLFIYYIPMVLAKGIGTELGFMDRIVLPYHLVLGIN